MASSTIQSDLFHRELQREKVWSRIHLVPLLMAEGDRDLYRRQQAALAREKEIMKDVPGWQVRFISCPYFNCCCDRSLMIITIAIRPCRPGLLSANNLHYACIMGLRRARVCTTTPSTHKRTLYLCDRCW